jgi:HTH-type transcriptional regulator, sugar sensing transcriptional regulator
MDNLISSLQQLGLTEYESRAYHSLVSLGIADARKLCSHSGVPSSKIYSIMSKFELMGLAEIQQSKPARFKPVEPALGVQRLVKVKEREIDAMKETLPLLQSALDSIYSGSEADSAGPFFNLQFGMRDHVQKHLPQLASARSEILSYFESTCLNGAKVYGHTVKHDIVGNILANKVSSRILFGTDDKKLIDGFVRGLPDSAKIEVRITKRIHAPFHVIDRKSAIVVVDNPLFADGRIASLHIVDKALAKELQAGYSTLWDSAKSL